MDKFSVSVFSLGRFVYILRNAELTTALNTMENLARLLFGRFAFANPAESEHSVLWVMSESTGEIVAGYDPVHDEFSTTPNVLPNGWEFGDINAAW